MQVQPIQPIRTQPAPRCVLCGAQGTVVYSGLKDRSYAAPGEWSFRRCESPSCGALWLDPVPIPEDVGLAYQGYYTHNQPEPGPSLLRSAVYGTWHAYLGWRFGYKTGVGPRWAKPFAPLALMHPGGGDELDAAAMHLPAPSGKARVLDVGCGSGVLLARMKSLGWEVEGVEVDPGGVEAGRKRGVPVRLGTVADQKFPDASFDAVHSAHVIEHVHDPVGLLKECQRILKPGGQLVFLTPNVESFGHSQYKEAWLNLDPPRHLILFTPAALQRAAEEAGLLVQRVDTSVRTAWVYAALSECIRRTGRGEMSELGKLSNIAAGIRFQLRERFRLRSHSSAGDELRLFATRK